ncbi:MAG: hypothetical protein LBL81_00380 [Tannerella sp.]|jgi:hypothetical protein|nr:hypothetical protein [Tannerella sp.]
MKNLMSKVLLFAVLLLVSATASAQQEKTFSGTWSYETTAVPPEYQSGQVRFAQQAGQTLVFVTFGEGSDKESLAPGVLLKQDGKYQCLLDVQNMDVNLSVSKKGKNLQVLVNVPNMDPFSVELHPVKAQK